MRKPDYQVSGIYTALAIFVLFAIVAAQNERINDQDSSIKAIEKLLTGPKYLCGIRKKIKGAWIDCDQLKGSE